MRPARLWTIAVAVAMLAVGTAQAQWKPTKPITIIVPWAAGGATDQVTRLAAAELEPALGQKIVVVNQPGGAGSIGTKSVLEGPKDGYTWTAGAAQDLGRLAADLLLPDIFAALDLLDKPLRLIASLRK